MAVSTPPAADAGLIGSVSEGLAARADPAKATGMQAYMKSSMPYLGATMPIVRAVCRDAFGRHPLDGFERWRDTALAMWRGASHREERYAAIELTGHRSYREHQTLDALPMYEEMVVTGAWWDYVDTIAIHRIGPLLKTHRRAMTRTMRAWSRDRDLWKRRSSIISQVAFKEATDLDLLYECIEPNVDDRDFFIRKAIGWALRAHAWTDPGEVVRYVTENEGRLSPLSKREALKNVGRTSVGEAGTRRRKA